MSEQYCEVPVKCVDTVQAKLKRIGLILLIIVTIPLMAINQFMYLIPVAATVFCIYMFPRLKAQEYEYIYVDGQIDFDRISGGVKRKTMYRVDLENVAVVAPTGSDDVREFDNREGLKTKNFSSLAKDAKTYTLIEERAGVTTKIIFEPDEDMLDKMKFKAPRKIKKY